MGSIFNSLRWRIQLWYGLLLIFMVAGLGIFIDQQIARGRRHEIQMQLEGTLRHLIGQLREPPRDGFRDPLALGPPGFRPGPPVPFDRRPDEPRPREPGPPPPVFHASEWEYAVRSAGGARILQSDNWPSEDEEIWRGIEFRREPTPRHDGEFEELAQRGPDGEEVLVRRRVSRDWHELQQMRWKFALAGLSFLTVALGGGWWLSGRVLEPIARIGETAESISAQNLSRRIDVSQVDVELRDLAEVLNATFARLEGAFGQLTRFTADASHELRTPLTILQSHVELALSRPRSAAEYQETLQKCLSVGARMTALVEGLLLLARVDAQQLALQPQPTDLAALVGETCELMQPLAQAQQVTLTAEVASIELAVDPLRLSQALQNLIQNGIAYNRPGGTVTVRLTENSHEVLLAVTDTGQGIAAADLRHLFERFYRVDPARARSRGGTGLGLAIAQSLVAAHGGTITVTSQQGQGSTFAIHLPRSKS